MKDYIVRNFSIVAHIDHGKTTLTDRLLLSSGAISQRDFRVRMLDSNPIEQERGITIKLAPVRFDYTLSDKLSKKWQSKTCRFHLIDTPGHVDFSYEVSRSLAAAEAAVLLIDASQGVQAQTLSNYQKAVDQGLVIIPVLNKVDLPSVDLDRAKLELMEVFSFDEEEIIAVSAKTGVGMSDLFTALVERVPNPSGKEDKPLQGLVFSSYYDAHKGVVCYVRIMEGRVTKNDRLQLLISKTQFEPSEIGIFSPQMKPIESLGAGDVGYVATGLKELSLAQVGDTIGRANEKAIALPGYKQPQLMVYMDFYPLDGKDYTLLLDSMRKLMLNDSALEFIPTHSQALGNGLRVGFLGILHAEIVQERLEREFELNLIATSPSVKYKIDKTDGEKIEISSPSDLPDPSQILAIFEPMVRAIMFSPKEYVGAIMNLVNDYRGEQLEVNFFGERVQLVYKMPLPELIVTFFDELKSVTSGYGSVEYEVMGYERVKAVKLSILVNKEPVEALSRIVVADKADEIGKQMVKKLKEVIPKQLFEIPIQAAIGGTIIARETVKAHRKDVTAKLYGGDRTRRMKLLEKQKKGKERRKQFGRVEIPQEAFMAVLRKD